MHGVCGDKRRGLRALRSVLLANLFLVPAVPAFADGELPSGGQIVAGSGAIGTAGNALTVTQSSSRAIINWQNFSIGSGNSVQINNGSGATLNRVITNSPSNIAGSLTSTGSTYLINQNGVVITPTGKVVTGGSFIGSTRDTSDSAFMQGGAQQFTGNSSGSVVNQGKIVSTGGDVVLVGKLVNNSGSIAAKNGTAALVAGDDVTLQPSGSGLQIKVTAGSGDATNSGTVEAAQAMLNAAGGNVYALAGNNGGTIRATGSSVIDGHVWLTAGGQASVTGGVSARNADGSGGAISVTGHDIDISGSLDVSAYSPFGSGGSASVIAGGVTKVTGAIKARAGSQGGNGGSIETSGNVLNIGGATIDASAPAGLAGTWLLDPYSLTVGGGPVSTAPQSPPGTWTSDASGGLVLNTDINNALNAGTSVVLQTSGSLGDGFGNGDITVGAAIQMTGLSNASLTLKAAGSIDILQGISSTGGALAVTLNSNTLGGGGYVNIASAISTNGGDLVIGGGANPLNTAAVGTAAQVVGVLVNGAINTAGGAVTLNGIGYGGSGNGSANIGVMVAGAINAGGGAISITGTGGNSSGANNIGINQNGTITTTGVASITLNGTGGGSGMGESGYQTTANITAGTGNISITGVSSAAATVNSTRGVGLLGGTVSTAGAGTITIAGTALGNGSGASAISSNGVVTAVDGLISLTGINNSTSTGAGNNGVNINTAGSAVRSTGTGGVKIVGQGGGSGISTGNSGVTVNNGGVVQSTGGGSISITGTGGGNGGSGSSNAGVTVSGAISGNGSISITGTGGASSGTNNYGVNVAAAITGSGGAISIVGTGGAGSGNFNYGINQGAFAITNAGTGSITLNGTGGGTGASEYGYLLSGGSIAAGTGNISITGQGGTSANDGVGVLLHGTGISTAGAGTITIAGTATGTLTAAREDAAAIDMPNITAVDGLISITGINNSIGAIDGNSGAHLTTNARVISTGLGGVSVNGVGGGSGVSFNDYGVQINGGNTIQSTGGGAVTITGTGGDGGGSGASNFGVLISHVAATSLAGSGGAISITGIGGNSSGLTNYGVFLDTAISNTGGGSISLTGTGGGSGNSANGISLGNSTATISNTGSGNITLLGTATGSGTAGNGVGINFNSGSVTAVNGLISVTGKSNSTGTGGGNTGVGLPVASNIKSTGTGGITIVGFGGGSGAGSNNSGVVLSVANAIQSTGGGTITITGTGGGNGGSGTNNNGVNVFGTLAGSGGAISITGTGGNSSGANNVGISQTAVISNTGAGSITLNGTGGGSGSGENGYLANAGITAGTGNISITGVSSANATINNNRGAGLMGGTVSTSGAGTITIVGTALGSGSGASAVSVNGTVTAVDGLISITGTDNSVSTGNGNNGVNINGAAAVVRSTGTGGITITGKAGGSGASTGNSGVTWNTGGVIQSTGGGAVTIMGTGGDNGGSGANNYGVFAGQSLNGSGGAISITGRGGNSSGGINTAILQSSGTAITNTGTGGIFLVALANGSALGDLGLESLAAGAGPIVLNAPGSVSSNGAVTGGILNLLGAGGSFTLTNAGNAVTRIVANTGSVNYSQTGDLTVGAAGVGVTASGTVKLVSNGGNLTIANGTGVTAGGTGNALILEAGASTLQPNATGGDFINNAGAAALSTPNGYWLVYTGNQVGAGTVDGGLAYTAQYGTDTSFTPAPSANFLFFRYNPPPPTVDVTASLTGSVIKTYDGTMLAYLDASNYLLTGVNPADQGSVVLTVNGTPISLPTPGLFSSRNVGSNLLVTVSNLGLNQLVSMHYQLTSTTISANIGTINPALLTLSAVSDTKNYDGTTTSNIAPSFAGLALGDSLTGLSQSFASKNVMGIGGSTLVLSDYVLTDGNNGNNYTVQVTATAPGTIIPATLTFYALTEDKVYDGTTSASLTPNVVGVVMPGDSLTGLKQAYQSKNVLGIRGSFLLPEYVLDDGNGGNNYTQFVNGVYATITPAQLTVSAVSDTKVYDGTTVSSATPSVIGLQTGDSLTGLSQAFTSKNVMGPNGSTLVLSDYVLTDGNNGNNYTVQTTTTAPGTITPAQLLYVANPVTRTYGTSIGNGQLTGSLGGIQAGDTQATVVSGKLKFKTDTSASTNVGSYAITGRELIVINPNYLSVIGQAAGNATALTVVPAQLTYKANNASRTYGAADPVFTGTVTGFVLGQTQASATTGTLMFTTTADASSNVGQYPIYGSGLTANFGNYYFVQAASNDTALTIKPATLTYVATQASRTYGTANPVFTGTVTGFVLGQDINSATTGTLAFNSPATAASNPGKYAINGFGLAANNGNYVFVQALANKEALTILH